MTKSDIYSNTQMLAYYGQHLHIIRNGGAFSLSDVFKTGSGSTITYEINDYLNSGNGFSYSNTTDKYTYGGISLNKTSGEIVATAYTPSMSLSGVIKLTNIIVKVTISGSPNIIHKVSVFIHDSLDSAWLGPSTIQVYNNGLSYRPTIYAKFNDANTSVIADLSGQPGFIWTLSNSLQNHLEFYSSSNQPRYNGYFKIKTGASMPSSILLGSISAQLPQYLDITSSLPPISTQVAVNPQLSTMLLSLSGTTKSIADSKHVIILGDGYLATERNIFETHARQVVQKLNGSSESSPWKYLKNSISYWGYFISSGESGGSLQGDYIRIGNVVPSATKSYFMSLENYIEICDDLIINTLKTTNKGVADCTAKDSINVYYKSLTTFIDWSILSTYTNNPLISSTTLTIKEIIEKVGFPSKEDLGKSLSIKLNEWNASTNSSITSSDINSFTYHLWTLLAHKQPLAVKDTAWHIANGKFRSVDNIAPSNFYESILDISPITSGINISPIKAFISTFNDVRANGIGSYIYTSVGAPAGDANRNFENENFVIFLSRVNVEGLKGNHIRVSDGSRLVTSTYDPPKSWQIVCEPNTNGCFVPEIVNNTNLDVSELGTAVHEFSHNFLLDEYGGPYSYSTTSDDLNLQNLQTRNAASTSSMVDGEKIKWLWPRITAVGKAIGDLIHIAGNIYSINIGETSNGNFNNLVSTNLLYKTLSVDDYIVLRKRNIYLQHDYPIFQIKNITGNTYQLEYKSKSATFVGRTSSVVTSFSVGDYLKYETLLIRPYWDPTNTTTPPDKFLSLVHKDIINIISSQHNPLLDLDISPYNGLQLPNLSIPSTISHPNSSQHYKLVGLYAGGGRRYRSNLYHPTGYCIMRHNTNLGITSSGNATEINRFCPVCQYIIVDSIDATCHPFIDKDYEIDYPR